MNVKNIFCMFAVMGFCILGSTVESDAAIRFRANPRVVRNRLDRTFNRGYRQGARAVRRYTPVIRPRTYRAPIYYRGGRYVRGPGIYIGF